MTAVKDCPECGSPELKRASNGELTCRACGLVLEDEVPYAGSLALV